MKISWLLCLFTSMVYECVVATDTGTKTKKCDHPTTNPNQIQHRREEIAPNGYNDCQFMTVVAIMPVTPPKNHPCDAMTTPKPTLLTTPKPCTPPPTTPPPTPTTTPPTTTPSPTTTTTAKRTTTTTTTQSTTKRPETTSTSTVSPCPPCPDPCPPCHTPTAQNLCTPCHVSTTPNPCPPCLTPITPEPCPPCPPNPCLPCNTPTPNPLAILLNTICPSCHYGVTQLNPCPPCETITTLDPCPPCDPMTIFNPCSSTPNILSTNPTPTTTTQPLTTKCSTKPSTTFPPLTDDMDTNTDKDLATPTPKAATTTNGPPTKGPYTPKLSDDKKTSTTVAPSKDDMDKDKDKDMSTNDMDNDKDKDIAPADLDHDKDKDIAPVDLDHDKDKDIAPIDLDHDKDKDIAPIDLDHDKDKDIAPIDLDHDKDKDVAPIDLDHDKDKDVAPIDLDHDKDKDIAPIDLDHDKDKDVAPIDLDHDKDKDIAPIDLDHDKDKDLASPTPKVSTTVQGPATKAPFTPILSENTKLPTTIAPSTDDMEKDKDKDLAPVGMDNDKDKDMASIDMDNDKDKDMASIDMDNDKDKDMASIDMDNDKDKDIAPVDMDNDKDKDIAPIDMDNDKDKDMAPIDLDQDKDRDMTPNDMETDKDKDVASPINDLKKEKDEDISPSTAAKVLKLIHKLSAQALKEYDKKGLAKPMNNKSNPVSNKTKDTKSTKDTKGTKSARGTKSTKGTKLPFVGSSYNFSIIDATDNVDDTKNQNFPEDINIQSKSEDPITNAFSRDQGKHEEIDADDSSSMDDLRRYLTLDALPDLDMDDEGTLKKNQSVKNIDNSTITSSTDNVTTDSSWTQSQTVQKSSTTKPIFAGNEVLNTYISVRGKRVLFEGDMVVPMVDLELFLGPQHGLVGSFKGEPDPAAGVRRRNLQKWPDRMVPYLFNDNIASEGSNTSDTRMLGELGLKIHSAISKWETKTCLNFTDIKGMMQDEEFKRKHPDYIEFFYSGPSGRCYSDVGRVGGKQRIHVGGTCMGDVLHMIGHAIGLYHEHTRVDRDRYVNINWDKIKKEDKHNFAKYNKFVKESSPKPFDCDSLMHISPDLFAKDAIVCKDKESTKKSTVNMRYRKMGVVARRSSVKSRVLGQRKEISQKDAEKIHEMYNCDKDYIFI